MSNKKRVYVPLVTPQATAAHAWLNKADEGHEFSDGKFKVTLIFDDNDATKAFVADVKKAALKSAEGNEIKLTSKSRPGIELIEEGDSLAEKNPGWVGKWKMKAASQFKPALLDKDKNDLPESVVIMSGDTIRAIVGVGTYSGLGTGGVSFQLRKVQLIEKNAAWGGDEDFPDFEDDMDAIGSDATSF